MPYFSLTTPSPQWVDANGDPMSGRKLFIYEAGTSTKVTTYVDNGGVTPNSNPIILDSLGMPPQPIYVPSGSYKMVLAPATDTDPPTSPIWTVDDVIPVNDTGSSTATPEWVTAAAIPTYLSGTQFSLPGDWLSSIQVGRRIRSTVTAGDVYGTITVATFGAGITTVTIANDSAALDSGLSSVAYGFMSATDSSMPVASDVIPLRAAAANRTRTLTTSLSSLTAARTWTVQDKSGTVALLDDLPVVGAIYTFPATSAPTGFLKANGALLSRVTYANLWAFAQASGNLAASDGAWLIGEFSPGDGSTTFRIPDLRGVFGRFWADNGATYDPGRAIGTVQTSQNLSHFHNAPGITNGTGGTDIFSYAAGGYTMNGQTGLSGGTEARPVNVPLLACIRY